MVAAIIPRLDLVTRCRSIYAEHLSRGRAIPDVDELAYRPGQLDFVAVPTGVARYPKEEVLCFPRSCVERHYNVTHWAVMPRGGHFAAMKQPAPFAEDVRNFFRTVR